MPEKPAVSNNKPEKTDKAADGGGAVRRRPKCHVAIDQERCKGCGYCVAFCPLGVLSMSNRFNSKGYHYPEVVDQSRCSGCDLCGMYCPDFAITGGPIRDEKEEGPGGASA